MIEAHVGRLLPASLHQAITDELPQRIDFYEEFLRGQRMRDGTIGLAPMSAVLGFLRTEGEAYDRVCTRAGRLSAEWAIAAMSPLRRRGIRLLPRSWRGRAALKVAAEIVRETCSTSRAVARRRDNEVTVEVRESVFCNVRERPPQPLCEFYLALVTETLARFNLPAAGRVDACHARDGGSCRLRLQLSEAAAGDRAAA